MNGMAKWARMRFKPVLPIGENNAKITGSPRHVELSRSIAEEGIVLLRNERNMLPLAKGARVAVFGKAQIDYVKVGGGSGDVFSEYTYNIYDGLKLKGDSVEVFEPLSDYYKNYVAEEYEKGGKNGMIPEAPLSEELLLRAKEYTDTAIITICRYSGEGSDRRGDGTDAYFTLSEEEKAMVEAVTANFKNVVVLLNVGAMIDTSWFAANDKISAALMIWQGGMEGALAAARVLVGEVTPSGKLVDTCAESLEDYPSSETFHESADYVKYTEDIFVGYRYFETVPDKSSKVIYPFGYGLSYTSFELSRASATLEDGQIFVSVNVKNTGSFDGKEVVQLYYSAPSVKMTKPKIELAAFAKTKLLKPSEMQTIVLKFAVNDMVSYDDLGVIAKSAWVLESGEYKLFVGTSAENLSELDFKYNVPSDTVTEQLTEYCAPKNLGKRLTASGEYVDVPDREYTPKSFKNEYTNEYKGWEEKRPQLVDVHSGKISLDDFISTVTDEELVGLLCGKPSEGVSNVGGMGGLAAAGIPTPMTTDGPAGVRIHKFTGVRTTAFPIATMVACTWNTELAEALGEAGGKETLENNLSMWLTPALNIHRSPLCGRNFEYFSEDPLIAGKMAAAIVRGIQSVGIVATPKHFACNNKETNRKESNSILSERALREIYLRGFEICVKESSPKFIMTAYNVINGVRASENAELITGILRGEWGYSGLVTTDWNNTASQTVEVLAGNDIRMPVTAGFDLAKGFGEGRISRSEVAVSVKRLLEMILWLK